MTKYPDGGVAARYAHAHDIRAELVYSDAEAEFVK